MLQVVHHEQLMADVQVVGRLVENEHIRALCHRARYENHLSFAAGETLDASIRKMFDPQFLQSGRDDLLFILFVLVLLCVQAHGHNITHGEVEGAGCVLADIPDFGGEIPGREVADRAPVYEYIAAVVRNDAKGSFDQGGFSAPIGSDDADDLVLVRAEAGARENILAAQLYSDIVVFYCHFPLPPYPFLIIRNMKNGAPIKAVTMPKGSSAAPWTLRA